MDVIGKVKSDRSVITVCGGQLWIIATFGFIMLKTLFHVIKQRVHQAHCNNLILFNKNDLEQNHT